MNNSNQRYGVRRDTALSATMLTVLAIAAFLYCNKAQSGDGSFFSANKPLSTERLSNSRGAKDYKIANINDVHGTVQNNTAQDLVTGSNSITNGAFSGVNGFPVVIQNSGNNVVIQSSTILNIGMQP